MNLLIGSTAPVYLRADWSSRKALSRMRRAISEIARKRPRLQRREE